MRRILILAALLCAAPFVRAEDLSSMSVLLIVGDDHGANVMGCYGNAKARTPNLDKLAASGMRFERAYCNSPVCTASRQSFLTGQMPQAVGVTLLSTPLDDEAVTLAHVLGMSGYRTLAAGKMHFNNTRRHGFDEVFETEQAERKINQRGREDIDPSVAVQPLWRPFSDPASVWLNSANLPWGAHEWELPDDAFAHRAAEFTNARGGWPFFVVASFRATHSPFIYPVEMAGKRTAAEFDPPEPGPEDAPQIPLIFKDLTREQKQGITAAYYSAAEYLDSRVGALLDYLDMLKLSEKIIVIYIGDHGYSLGEHGRFEKHCFYENVVRTPLIIRWPGHTKPGSVSNAMVELVDLFPTIVDICGLPLPPGIDGRSLVPVLDGKTTEHRKEVASVYFENEEAMIRGERYKLIYTSGKRERKDGYKTANPLPGRTVRLYDAQTDPGEFKNIAAEPAMAETVAAMEKELLARLKRGRNYDAPAGMSVPDQLDLYLIPPEEQKKLDADLKVIQTK